MSNFKIFLRDGKLMVGEFPEGRNFHQDFAEEKRHNAAVEAAKKNAVEVVNPICGAEYEPMQEGQLYDLPKGWTVEIKGQYWTGSPLTKNSRLPEWIDIDKGMTIYEGLETRKIARLIPASKVSGIAAIGVPESGDFDTLPGKGDKGGECNRTVCKNTEAEYYNHSTRMYYCAECAVLINDANKADAIRLYGHELCTLEESKSPVIPEGSEKEKFEVLLYGEWVELSENQYLQAINNNHYGRINGVEQHRKSADKPAIDDTLKGANELTHQKQLAERDQTIKELREGLTNLYKEIRSRFAKDNDIAFESMSQDLVKPMLEARKLIEP
jgi:hypothetical protein